jgi:hypothetical protein
MSDPTKNPEFNAALKKMLAADPKQNKDLKLGKDAPKAKKEPKPWSWSKR